MFSEQANRLVDHPGLGRPGRVAGTRELVLHQNYILIYDSEYFTDLSKTLLIGKSSEFYSDLNALHPFRDDNGRTQRILFEHIVLNCGYSISWESVSRQEWIDANIESFSGRNQAMTEIFAKCIGKELRE